MPGTATKAVYNNHDFGKVGAIINAQLNPMTTAQRTTLGGTLTATHKGVFVWDTDLNAPYWWTGTVWQTVGGTQSGLTPKGNVAFNATEPATPTVGDLYVFTNAGTNTWEGSTVVQAGDQVYWDGTAWQFIQGNVIQGTAAVQGILQLASDAEAIAGTDTAKAVTSANLAAREASKKYSRTYFNSSVTTVADTPLTITHNLGLQHRDAYALSFKVGNSQVDVDTDSIDANSCSITSNVALTGSITVIGS